MIPHPLDEIAEEALASPLDPDRVRFQIGNDEAAEWAMRRLNETIQTLNNADDLVNKEIARLMEWHRSVTAEPERRLNYFEGLLTEYGLKQRLDDERKSVSLPSGRIQTRSSESLQAIVLDDDGFVDWASKNGHDDLLIVKRSPRVSAIKQAKATAILDGDGKPSGFFMASTDDGEVIPHVRLCEQAISVKVTPETTRKGVSK